MRAGIFTQKPSGNASPRAPFALPMIKDQIVKQIEDPGIISLFMEYFALPYLHIVSSFRILACQSYLAPFFPHAPEVMPASLTEHLNLPGSETNLAFRQSPDESSHPLPGDFASGQIQLLQIRQSGELRNAGIGDT